MQNNGHEWTYAGIAWTWDIQSMSLGWVTPIEYDGTPIGELWFCLGPLAICFD